MGDFYQDLPQQGLALRVLQLSRLPPLSLLPGHTRPGSQMLGAGKASQVSAYLGQEEVASCYSVVQGY